MSLLSKFSIFKGGFVCWELYRTLKQVEQSEMHRRESEEDIRLLGVMSEKPVTGSRADDYQRLWILKW